LNGKKRVKALMTIAFIVASGGPISFSKRQKRNGGKKMPLSPSLIPPWEMVFLTCRADSPIPTQVSPGDGGKTYFPAVGISRRGSLNIFYVFLEN
jgi:hypothetical protein